jgi:hypothetical protein
MTYLLADFLLLYLISYLLTDLLTFYLLNYLLTPWSRVFLQKLTAFAASQEISHIYGTRSSLPYSQAPATCPYPEL